MGEGQRGIMSKNNGTDSLKQSVQQKRVNLAEWRASRIHDLELPSGLTIKLRDVTMTDLMLTGKLPDAMMDLAQDASSGGKESIDLKAMAKSGAEFKQMLDALIRLCVVEPALADVGDDEHLCLADFNGDDKMAIFNFVNRGVETLHSFREGEAEPVAVV